MSACEHAYPPGECCPLCGEIPPEETWGDLVDDIGSDPEDDWITDPSAVPLSIRPTGEGEG